MNFTQAAALATLWVDIVCKGRARIMREETIAKPYGWIFFYQSNEFLDTRDPLYLLGGNSPIIVNRYSLELRVTGTALPLEHYLGEYEKTLPSAWLLFTPEPPKW